MTMDDAFEMMHVDLITVVASVGSMNHDARLIHTPQGRSVLRTRGLFFNNQYGCGFL
jgi:hypothetical protein